jgi:GMP synthase (glutamine-hydrolysing)
MKIRLLQARNPDDPVRQREQQSFLEHLELNPEDLEVLDVLTGQATFDAATDGVDAVVIGGSGDYSITDNNFWVPSFIKTLGELADAGFPSFASCFGFQGMVMGLGGRVQRDEGAAEVGSFDIELLGSAESDPLFKDLPAQFLVQQGHKDRAVELPQGVTLLAKSDRCPYQAIRVGDGPVYATQFHPELTGIENKQRFIRYYDNYVDALGQRQTDEIMSSFKESPIANALLKSFKALAQAHKDKA